MDCHSRRTIADRQQCQLKLIVVMIVVGYGVGADELVHIGVVVVVVHGGGDGGGVVVPIYLQEKTVHH